MVFVKGLTEVRRFHAKPAGGRLRGMWSGRVCVWGGGQVMFCSCVKLSGILLTKWLCVTAIACGCTASKG